MNCHIWSNELEVTHLCKLQTKELINIYDFQRLFLNLKTSQRLVYKVKKLKIISLSAVVFSFAPFWPCWTHQKRIVHKATGPTVQHIRSINNPFNPSTYQLLGIPNRRCFTKKSCESIICTNGNTAFARWQKGDQFLLETSKLQFLSPEWIVKPWTKPCNYIIHIICNHISLCIKPQKQHIHKTFCRFRRNLPYHHLPRHKPSEHSLKPAGVALASCAVKVLLLMEVEHQFHGQYLIYPTQVSSQPDFCPSTICSL